MCKVACVTKVTDQNRDYVWILMTKLGEIMSRANNDGLGYAAFDKSGNIFGERWLFNRLAFRDFSKMKDVPLDKVHMFYNFFGEKVLRDEANGIILHTRMATCEKGLKNVHPFVDDLDKPTVATIHNGIISNHNTFTKKYSTCDSEVLVHLYKQYDAANHFSKIQSFFPDLNGWMTVLNLTKDENGNKFIDGYTDNGRLESYYIPQLDVHVYSTSGYDIEEACTYLGLKFTTKTKFKANTAFRIDINTNKFTHTKILTSRPHNVIDASGQSFSDFNWHEWINGSYKGD